MNVMKNSFSTSQNLLPQLTLIGALVDSFSKEATDCIDKNLPPFLK